MRGSHTTSAKAMALEKSGKKSARADGAHDTPVMSTPDLQLGLGNQAMQHLLRCGVIQAKLAVGPPRDPQEDEADRVAALVTNSSRDIVQRKCACGAAAGASGECEGCTEQRQQAASGVPVVQRRATNGNGVAEVPSIVHQVLGSSGRPLDSATRTSMEGRFGHDFSDVRIHTDRRAADSAEAINALAYTYGNNVVFGRGQYVPDSQQGQRLLAHELTHVVQQVRKRTPRNEVRPGLGARKTTSSAVVLRQLDPAAAQNNPPPGPLAALPSPSPIEPKPPVVSGDLIKFERVALSTDAEFDRYQLEQMVASEGLEQTTSFVGRLTSTPERDQPALASSEELRQGVGHGDTSGAPLPTDIEDETRHRIANKERVQQITLVVQREFNLLRTEANEFLENFETIARDKMFEALRLSQDRVEGEAKHYGFSPGDLRTGPEQATTKYPQPHTPADVVQQMRGDQADTARYRTGEKSRADLVKAAVEVRRRKMVVDRLEAQLQAARNPPTSAAFPKPMTASDEARAMSIERQLQKAKLGFNEFLQQKEAQFPILAAYVREPGDLNTIAEVKDVNSEGMKAALLGQINEKLKNITETRENMRAGRISAWNIPVAVEGTRHVMKVDKGTMLARVLDDRAASKQQEKADEKAEWQAISTVSFALGMLAIIPTPLSPALGGASTVLNLAVAAHDLDEYIIESAASGTDFDKALAISQADPSLFWLAVELVGAGIDLGMALSSLRGISALEHAVIAGEEGAVKALETEAGKLGPAVMERVVSEAEAARKVLLTEARAGGKTAQLVSEDAIKAGKLAEHALESGGHTYQVLKDGRIVRCSDWCASLELLFGDLMKRNPHLAGDLEKLQGLKGRAAAEAAAQVSERLEQVRKFERMSVDELEKVLDQPEFAKGTPLADDARYARYRKKGGELPFDDWYSKSRGGRGGGPEHQQRVDEILKEFGPTTTTERSAGNRFADAYTPPQGGEKAKYHQVGDTNKRGDPIARERRAIDDIRRTPEGKDADIIFYPKDATKEPLINPDRDPRWAKTWSTD
jgi:hypothetical protein